MDPPEAFDVWASFYDARHGDMDMGDVGFYRELAEGAAGPVLEIGCGTGRIYLELLRAGVDASGIDVSADMLDVLRGKAASEGLEADVERADMRSFALDREFALVIVPFRAFLHALTIDDQLETLERIHAHLEPGGRLALNFFVPDPEVIVDYGTTEESVTLDGESYTLVDHQVLEDPVERIVRIERALVDAPGETVRETAFRIRLVTKSEFELLLRLTPFGDWTVYGGFDREPLDSVGQEMVWVAEA